MGAGEADSAAAPAAPAASAATSVDQLSPRPSAAVATAIVVLRYGRNSVMFAAAENVPCPRLRPGTSVSTCFAGSRRRRREERRGIVTAINDGPSWPPQSANASAAPASYCDAHPPTHLRACAWPFGCCVVAGPKTRAQGRAQAPSLYRPQTQSPSTNSSSLARPPRRARARLGSYGAHSPYKFLKTSPLPSRYVTNA